MISWRVALLLGAAIHVDWHLARHGHDGRSLGWSWHWVVAIPMFALAAWYMARRFRNRLLFASVITLGAVVLLGEVLEGVGEILLYGDPLREVFAAERLAALSAFMAAGLVSYVAVARLART